MDKKPKNTELEKDKLLTHMQRIDKEKLSPQERANKVYGFLNSRINEGQEDFTQWDLVCFSAEFLGNLSVTELEYIQAPMKDVLRLLYLQHYYVKGVGE